MTADIKELTIVLIGSFNPVIYHPQWFLNKELIANVDASDAKIGISHPEVTEFSMEWLKVQVLRDKFICKTKWEDKFPLLKDLVISTFSILAETPIVQLGINLEAHYKVANEKKWHEFGHTMLPKNVWGKALVEPKTMGIDVRGERNNKLAGNINVHLSASPIYDNVKNFGIFFRVNDHYEIEKPPESINAVPIMEILDNEWKESLIRSEKILSKLMANV